MDASCSGWAWPTKRSHRGTIARRVVLSGSYARTLRAPSELPRAKGSMERAPRSGVETGLSQAHDLPRRARSQDERAGGVRSPMVRS